MAVTKELLLSLTVGDLKSIDAGMLDPTKVGKGGSTGKAGTDRVLVPFELHEEALVNLKTNETHTTVFIVHGVEGSADTFKPLATKLEANVYGFQFTENHDSKSVEAIARRYLSEIKKVQPSGPYNIAGFSTGSTVAYEIARQLAAQNQEVCNLVLLDGCPTYKVEVEGLERTAAYDVLESNNLLSGVPDDHKMKFKETLTGDVDKDTKIALELVKEFAGIEPDPEVVRSYLDFGLAVKTYDPERNYDGDVVHIKVADPSSYASTLPNEDYNVSKYCPGSVKRHVVKGDHWNFLSEANVEETATILNYILHHKE